MAPQARPVIDSYLHALCPAIGRHLTAMAAGPCNNFPRIRPHFEPACACCPRLLPPPATVAPRQHHASRASGTSSMDVFVIALGSSCSTASCTGGGSQMGGPGGWLVVRQADGMRLENAGQAGKDSWAGSSAINLRTRPPTCMSASCWPSDSSWPRRLVAATSTSSGLAPAPCAASRAE